MEALLAAIDDALHSTRSSTPIPGSQHEERLAASSGMVVHSGYEATWSPRSHGPASLWALRSSACRANKLSLIGVWGAHSSCALFCAMNLLVL